MHQDFALRLPTFLSEFPTTPGFFPRARLLPFKISSRLWMSLYDHLHIAVAGLPMISSLAISSWCHHRQYDHASISLRVHRSILFLARYFDDLLFKSTSIQGYHHNHKASRPLNVYRCSLSPSAPVKNPCSFLTGVPYPTGPQSTSRLQTIISSITRQPQRSPLAASRFAYHFARLYAFLSLMFPMLYDAFIYCWIAACYNHQLLSKLISSGTLVRNYFLCDGNHSAIDVYMSALVLLYSHIRPRFASLRATRSRFHFHGATLCNPPR
jgi:hypothetical protein